jgi:hypothetical protein
MGSDGDVGSCRDLSAFPLLTTMLMKHQSFYPLRHRSFSLLRHRPRDTAAKWFKYCGESTHDPQVSTLRLHRAELGLCSISLCVVRLQKTASARTLSLQNNRPSANDVVVIFAPTYQPPTITAEGGPNGECFCAGWRSLGNWEWKGSDVGWAESAGDVVVRCEEGGC